MCKLNNMKKASVFFIIFTVCSFKGVAQNVDTAFMPSAGAMFPNSCHLLGGILPPTVKRKPFYLK
jgi:hypothetical protein